MFVLVKTNVNKWRRRKFSNTTYVNANGARIQALDVYMMYSSSQHSSLFQSANKFPITNNTSSAVKPFINDRTFHKYIFLLSISNAIKIPIRDCQLLSVSVNSSYELKCDPFFSYSILNRLFVLLDIINSVSIWKGLHFQ